MARYRTPEAFAAALTSILKSTAAESTRTVAELRREFVLQRFLARLFQPTTDGTTGNWILKGGTGLLIRVPDSRHTRDIDLHHRGDTATAVAEIRTAALLPLDPFRFQPGEPAPLTGRHLGMRISLTAYLGAKIWETVPVDLAVATTEPVGTVDVLTPRPVLVIDDVEPMPPIALYPVAAQVADKLCAMYDHYGTAPSTRYHDLVDLIAISEHCTIRAGETLTALTSEVSHRAIALPHRMSSPGSVWPRGYAATARKARLPTALLSLDGALAAAQTCFDPLLSGQVEPGAVWDPIQRSWL